MERNGYTILRGFNIVGKDIICNGRLKEED